jgi:hypothetical protein
VHAPWRIVISYFVERPDCAGRESPSHQVIRIVDEYLDPHGGLAATDLARKSMLSRFVQKERGTVQRETDNRAKVPQLDGAEGLPVPGRGLRCIVAASMSDIPVVM